MRKGSGAGVRVAASIALAVAAATGIAGGQGADYARANYTKFEYRIPMRDGVRLFTSVYVPTDRGESYPILLTRTPYSVAPYGADAYRASLGPSDRFMRDGYIFVYQDVRGRMMSEGEFVDMRPHLPEEIRAGGHRREHRHLRHHRLAAEARPEPQRQGRDVRHFVPRLLHLGGHDRRASRAQGRLAAGADRRLVRRRRLPPQRRAVPAARLLVLLGLRAAAAEADDQFGIAVQLRHRRTATSSS